MDSVVRPGTSVPDFSLPDLDGAIHSPGDQRGRILVLNFWSAECPWSKRADGIIDELQPGWGDRVAVWWISPNGNETIGELRAAAQSRGIPLVLRDARHAIADQFGAVTTPHLFVIDEMGILRFSGAPDDVSFRQRVARRNYLAEAVAALLRGQLPDPAEVDPYGCAIVRYAF